MSTIEAISPFPAEELPRVWLWLADAGSTLLNDQGPQTMDAFVDMWLERGALTWGVWRDGELGGWVAYEPITEATGNMHCIFRKGNRRDSFWGQKTTVPALTQVVEQLWSIGVARIGMMVPTDNHAIQALIKRSGARREAVISATFLPDGQTLSRGGVPMTMVQYGLYLEDWNAQHQSETPAESSVEPVITVAMAGRHV